MKKPRTQATDTGPVGGLVIAGQVWVALYFGKRCAGVVQW